jgi:DNA mismatch repair protein MutS2
MSAISERLGIPRRARREPVPVTVRVGFGTPVLVISGPNTGGKTVALKTVGLLALMAQSGLHVPAAEGSVLPVFRRVYADIGDDQSIAADLSTFSAHLRAIVEMTRDLEAPTLVLLDEIGGGTDPTEGGALGVAVVDHFRQRGAMVVATTHHGLLKSYAQSTAGVAAASFGYDPASYEPTYRLALGVPGRSLALEMAERLGLPAPVVHDARARLENKEAQAEALLKKLEDGRLALERDTARLAEEREALAAARARAEADERAFAAQKRQALESFRRDLAQRGERAARQAADAIREAVQRLEAERASTRNAANVAAKARTEAIGAIRAAQEEATADLDLPREADAPALPLAVGARVRLRSLGVTGEVLQLAGDHAEVAVRGKRLKVPPAELIALPAAAAPGAVVASAAPVSAPSASEINVVGLRVDEALPRVDKALDTAALADRQQLRVVHGHGEGKLRRAVAEMLDGHPHVASFRPGGAGEGGAGVTVVELRE